MRNPKQRAIRPDRVGELVHRAVSTVIEHELWDDRLKKVTITGVEMSRDLKYARIYYSVLGDEEATAEAGKALKDAQGAIRMGIGREVVARVVPEITFHHDASIEYGTHMDILLAEIARKEGRSDGV